MTFNTLHSLWATRSAKQVYPKLVVSQSGEVCEPTGAMIARFNSYNDAKALFISAGWIVDGENITTIESMTANQAIEFIYLACVLIALAYIIST